METIETFTCLICYENTTIYELAENSNCNFYTLEKEHMICIQCLVKCYEGCPFCGDRVYVDIDDDSFYNDSDHYHTNTSDETHISSSESFDDEEEIYDKDKIKGVCFECGYNIYTIELMFNHPEGNCCMACYDDSSTSPT